MELKARHPDRSIDVNQGDANAFLAGLSNQSFRDGPATKIYLDWRGVLFVDPFGTALDWATVEHIAGLRRLDMWLLFRSVRLVGCFRCPGIRKTSNPSGWRD